MCEHHLTQTYGNEKHYELPLNEYICVKDIERHPWNWKIIQTASK